MRFLKRTFLTLFASLLMTSMASAMTLEEEFVQTRANEALAILADDSLDKGAKAERFRTFIDEATDVPRIARFVLGKYARGADPQKISTFTDVFRNYASGVYEAQLGNYAGEVIKVTGSQERKPGDAVVMSVISGGQLDEPLAVNWRIRTREGKVQVLDVQVFGIWLALQQRNEITAVLANNNGNISAAITLLEDKTVKGEYASNEQ